MFHFLCVSAKHYVADTTEPISCGLQTLEELLSWKRSEANPFNVAAVPLAPREPPLASCSRRTLVSHDMMGGYLDDRCGMHFLELNRIRCLFVCRRYKWRNPLLVIVKSLIFVTDNGDEVWLTVSVTCHGLKVRALWRPVKFFLNNLEKKLSLWGWLCVQWWEALSVFHTLKIPSMTQLLWHGFCRKIVQLAHP